MFKYVRTINACSGIVETINIPAPADQTENAICKVGTICCIVDGVLSNTRSTCGAKYLVLSAPNSKGEQCCLRIMPGMILKAESYFPTNECKIGDGVSFTAVEGGGIDCVDMGGSDCEIIDKKESGGLLTVVVL